MPLLFTLPHLFDLEPKLVASSPPLRGVTFRNGVVFPRPALSLCGTRFSRFGAFGV